MAETLNIDAPHTADLPHSWTGEMRALLALGLPMAAAQLAQFFIVTIDVLMIGRLGPEALAAASLGGVVYYFLWMVGSGPAMAVSPMVSQALGADTTNRKEARRSVRMALWAIFGLTPLVVIMTLLTEPLAIFFGQDAEISRQAAAYVFALSVGWPFAIGIMALRNFLAAIGKTTFPLLLVILTTALNAGLNYILIFGHFGAPRLELVGAGIASSLSYIISFGGFMLYISRNAEAREFDVFKNILRSDWVRLKEVIALGWPMSVTTIFEGMLFNAAVLIMGVIGVLEMAAYQVSLNVVSLAFMLPWGLSMAGAVRIGLARGAQNKPAEKRAALTTIGAGAIGMTGLAIIVAVFPRQIASIYLNISDPNNRAVIDLIAVFLPLASLFMVVDAVQVSANQLLRGLKDVKWPMVLTGVSYWVIGFPVAFILATHTDLGANGVWYGLTSGLSAACLLLGSRLIWQVWRR